MLFFVFSTCSLLLLLLLFFFLFILLLLFFSLSSSTQQSIFINVLLFRLSSSSSSQPSIHLSPSRSVPHETGPAAVGAIDQQIRVPAAVQPDDSAAAERTAGVRQLLRQPVGGEPPYARPEPRGDAGRRAEHGGEGRPGEEAMVVRAQHRHAAGAT